MSIEGHGKTETEVLAKMGEKLSRMESLLAAIASKLDNLEITTNNRLASAEERLKSLASQIRPPPRRNFEGLAGLTEVTPAMELTEEAVRKLARKPGDWVTVEDVAKETRRSLSTESAYLKLLSRAAHISKKPVYEGAGMDRRVRKYVYSCPK